MNRIIITAEHLRKLMTNPDSITVIEGDQEPAEVKLSSLAKDMIQSKTPFY